MDNKGLSYVYLSLPGNLNHNSYLDGPVAALERGSILILLTVQKSQTTTTVWVVFYKTPGK